MHARAPLLAALAGAAVLAVAAPRGAPRPAGEVTFLSGEATRAAGGQVEKLAVGSAVYAADVLETRRRTRLEVRLGDESVVRLGPLSRVVLREASFGPSVEDRKVSARLVIGKVWANVAKAVGGEARFEVQTENAVAGVRGTTFRVDAARDRSMVVKVYAGTVAVASSALLRPEHGAAGPGRHPVPGPQEVSREQWERIVTRMMQVRVSAAGVPAEPEPFALSKAGGDAWEEWNRSRDAQR